MEQEIKVGDWVHVWRAAMWSKSLEQITELCVENMYPYRTTSGHYHKVLRPLKTVTFGVQTPPKESFENRDLTIHEVLQWVGLYDPLAMDVCCNIADCPNVHCLSFLTKNAVFTIDPRAFLKAGDPVFYRARNSDPYTLSTYVKSREEQYGVNHKVYMPIHDGVWVRDVKAPTAQELADYKNLHGEECYEATLWRIKK